MANPHSPHLYEHLEVDEETGSEEEETETEGDDEEETEEGEEAEEEELITVGDSPTRVWSSGHLRNGGGEKRRREERGGEACSVNGIDSGDCSQSQESDWSRSEIDGLFCPICMEPWTNTGAHHISCLPCGHIYGFSCIKKWLEQGRNSGKCPQCNRKCSLKDVRKLFASRIAAVDEEAQKRIRSLEAKCASLKKKVDEWRKKEAGWQKRETELDLKVHQLKERETFLEHLLGDGHNRQSGYAAAATVGSCREQSASLSSYGSNFYGEGSSNSCIFVLKKALRVDGARLFDVDDSSQILLMTRRLPGIGGSGMHVLTKISLIHPHESEDIVLPSCTKAVKDLHFSPFNHNLALFASLGKKLSVLSMESNNVILNYDLPAAAWSCSWDFNSAHYLYAGLQNGSLLVFDMRQTVRPLESLNGSSCNPIHTICSLPHSNVRTLLSASSVGVCEWSFDGGEERSYLVPETENQGVCISLAYCPSSDDLVASFRPRIEMSNEMVASQPVLTPPIIGQGILGSRILLKKVHRNSYQKLGFSSTVVNDIRLPKSTIIHLENQKRWFASGEELSCELILQELPSFSVVQCLESRSHPVRDVKYTRAHNQGLLSCLSEDTLQLFSTSLS